MPAPSSPLPDLWLEADTPSFQDDGGTTPITADGQPVGKYVETRNGWSPTATGADRPTYLADSGFKSKPGISFSTSNFLKKASGADLTAGQTKMTMIYALRVRAFSSGPAFSTGPDDRMALASLGGATLSVFATTAPLIYAEIPAASTVGGQLIEVVYDGTLTGNANRLKIWWNRLPATPTFSDTFPASLSVSGTGISLGQFGNNTGVMDHIHLAVLGFKGVTLSDADREAWRNYLAEKYFTKTTYSLIADGDSNTVSQAANDNNPWVRRIYDHFGWTGLYVNGASVGKLWSQLSNGSANRDDWYAHQGIFPLAGTNDIGVTGDSSATIINNYIAPWIVSALSYRYPIFLTTILPNGMFNGAQETTRQAVNAYILGRATPGSIYTLNADTVFPNPNNLLHFSDGAHMTALGHQMLADAWVPIIQEAAYGTPVDCWTAPDRRTDWGGSRR